MLLARDLPLAPNSLYTKYMFLKIVKMTMLLNSTYYVYPHNSSLFPVQPGTDTLIRLAKKKKKSRKKENHATDFMLTLYSMHKGSFTEVFKGLIH